ncbi:unnamed protein product [Parascedosporium putredinis]|uniref:NAD-dependent epimerase/dehydratase domain-containing protein n=1 Tax=Parascedosporium putredinis TaxID=1442378 RepID=A0A9P1H2J0_9PEZI|nr:unnamed protein product [Parascedosporium putredinis]CAI7996158.1 unnamed protein product [Parascedosporium putredinis]
MATAVEVGTTGLVGSHILKTLLAHPAFSTVHAYSRRPLANASPKLQSVTNTDSDAWPASFPAGASIFFSALGTTKAQAGGIENQRKIDLDLNLSLAKAAKDAGPHGLPRMKGELVDGVKALGFKHTVILNPGLILGTREDSRPLEAVARTIAGFLGGISGGALTNSWAQDADTIAKAAVSAGVQILDGKREPGVWVMPQSEIVELGLTGWKDPAAPTESQ